MEKFEQQKGPENIEEAKLKGLLDAAFSKLQETSSTNPEDIGRITGFDSPAQIKAILEEAGVDTSELFIQVINHFRMEDSDPEEPKNYLVKNGVRVLIGNQDGELLKEFYETRPDLRAGGPKEEREG